MNILNENAVNSLNKTLDNIDISTLETGIYFVIIKNGNEQHAERLEKIK